MESPFLALPAELRLQIYEHALVCPSTSFRIRPLSVQARERHSPYNSKFYSRVAFGLLRSCRLVYKESVEILYSRNRFLALSGKGLLHFLHKIGGNTGFLRRMKLRLEGDGFASNWEVALKLLAREATALERLEICYRQTSKILGLGLNSLTACVMGEYLVEMKSLKTLVISGFYGKNWPSFFAKRTNAVVEAYAGVRVRKPGPGTDMDKYVEEVASIREQFEAYQRGTERVLDSDTEDDSSVEDNPLSPDDTSELAGQVSELGLSDSPNSP